MAGKSKKKIVGEGTRRRRVRENYDKLDKKSKKNMGPGTRRYVKSTAVDRKEQEEELGLKRKNMTKKKKK